jgi:hypothetical protein
MSRSGTSRVEPPADYAEWGALVEATVHHLNVERRLGIRYWEVWNEPNIWDFWRGSFAEYLRLYDTTVQAALAADPTVRIGGPSFSSLEPSGVEEFLRHEAEQNAKCEARNTQYLIPHSALRTPHCEGGQVDFLSWHAYGQAAFSLARQISQARAMVANYPQLRGSDIGAQLLDSDTRHLTPELFITEFNVLQGGPGDTSSNEATDKVDGAIAFLSTIETMQRERLDRAFLFELKDGRGPSTFWGRWGILTNNGLAKPVYYALKAFRNRTSNALPVQVRRGPADGTIGLLAYGSPDNSLFLLWHAGYQSARVKIALPPEFANVNYNIALFDKTHNNPALTGDTLLRPSPPRNARDLVFDLKPNSLVIVSSKQ